MSSDSKTFKGFAVKAKGEPFVPFEYTPRPLGDSDVEIKISHCGICHSDIHTVDSGWGPTVYPVIVGHEIVGEVVAAGKEVKDLKVGDRVGVGAQVQACLEPSCGACACGSDNHCPKGVFTYNSKYADGGMAYGGYQEQVRVPSTHAFKVPESIPSQIAAPLLCAGATVYSPLARAGVKPGMKVGIVGLGGLGHLAVMYAAKMGADVYAITRSDSKREDAIKLGAKGCLVSTKPEEVAAAANSFNVILCTATEAAAQFDLYMSLLGLDGTFIMVGAPEAPISFNVFSVIFKRIKFTGSLIGSRKEITDMLEFSAKHEVHPWVDVLPMDKVNEGVQRVRDGKVRYRIVLQN